MTYVDRKFKIYIYINILGVTNYSWEVLKMSHAPKSAQCVLGQMGPDNFVSAFSPKTPYWEISVLIGRTRQTGRPRRSQSERGLKLCSHPPQSVHVLHPLSLSEVAHSAVVFWMNLSTTVACDFVFIYFFNTFFFGGTFNLTGKWKMTSRENISRNRCKNKTLRHVAFNVW